MDQEPTLIEHFCTLLCLKSIIVLFVRFIFTLEEVFEQQNNGKIYYVSIIEIAAIKKADIGIKTEFGPKGLY